MLQPEDFRIEKYFFPHQMMEANPNYKADEPNDAHISLKVDCWPFGDGEDEKNRFGIQVSMSIDKDAHEGKNYAYAFYISNHGAFRYVGCEKLDPGQLCDQAKAIGAQVLVGALRERIMELSSRGPWGEFTLDTIGLKTLMAHAGSHYED